MPRLAESLRSGSDKRPTLGIVPPEVSGRRIAMQSACHSQGEMPVGSTVRHPPGSPKRSPRHQDSEPQTPMFYESHPNLGLWCDAA